MKRAIREARSGPVSRRWRGVTSTLTAIPRARACARQAIARLHADASSEVLPEPQGVRAAFHDRSSTPSWGGGWSAISTVFSTHDGTVFVSSRSPFIRTAVSMSVAAVRAFPVQYLPVRPGGGCRGRGRSGASPDFRIWLRSTSAGRAPTYSSVHGGKPLFSFPPGSGRVPCQGADRRHTGRRLGGGGLAWMDDSGALNSGPSGAPRGAPGRPRVLRRGGAAEPTMPPTRQIVLHRLDPVTLLGGRLRCR